MDDDEPDDSDRKDQRPPKKSLGRLVLEGMALGGGAYVATLLLKGLIGERR